MQDNSSRGFKIWAVDNNVYGPVELPVLVSWIKEERVTADTWIYSEDGDAWQKASKMSELQMFFRSAAPASARAAAPVAGGQNMAGLKPGALRRVKIFADMNDEQLSAFVNFMEIQNVRQWTELVKQGAAGDAMYLILEGELRVRLMIGGKESILATLTGGEFFGEISLFDSGPRSADVIANRDSILLKISNAAFQKLTLEAPQLATPFLMGIAKTLTARIRADNKRYKDSVNFSRTATGGQQQ